MSRWYPCKRREFIKRLRKLGFDGLYAGTRHEFMIFENHRLSIPFNAEYSTVQLKMMIGEVESIIGRSVSANEWNNLS